MYYCVECGKRLPDGKRYDGALGYEAMRAKCECGTEHDFTPDGLVTIALDPNRKGKES